MLIVRALAAAVIIAGIWLVGIPALLIALGAEPFPLRLGALRLLGAVPFAAGAVLFGWVTWTFAAAGRGTPLVFDAPVRLVAGGPHRSMRNPMYAGDVLILLGEGLLLESSAIVVYAGVLAIALHVLVVAVEEPRLRRRFGPRYERYCERVPRWVPRFPRG
jgi:protein-S-isoprenylcysteine O-methyltransferase Ste14